MSGVIGTACRHCQELTPYRHQRQEQSEQEPASVYLRASKEFLARRDQHLPREHEGVHVVSAVLRDGDSTIDDGT